jgi:AcrR family transcriptional regulator
MADKERKQQIIRAALKRFVKHGLNKTTLDEVARDLRIGKATLYHYFTSKEDLYYQALLYEISLYITDISTIFSAGENDLRKKIRDFFLMKEDFENRYKLIYDLVIHLITGAEFPKEKEIFSDLAAKEKEFFRTFFSPILKKGEVKPEETADLISRHGWSLIFENKLITADDSAKNCRELIINLVEKT